MNAPQAYIALLIAVLAAITVILVVVKRRKPHIRLSKLAGAAFLFVIAGLYLGESRLIGYGLIGIGVLLAVIDILLKRRK
jgi:hypothetical protein